MTVAENCGIPPLDAMGRLSAARGALAVDLDVPVDLDRISRRALDLGGACAPLRDVAVASFETSGGAAACTRGSDAEEDLDAEEGAVLDLVGGKGEVFRRAASCVGVFVAADRALFNWGRGGVG